MVRDSGFSKLLAVTILHTLIETSAQQSLIKEFHSPDSRKKQGCCAFTSSPHLYLSSFVKVCQPAHCRGELLRVGRSHGLIPIVCCDPKEKFVPGSFAVPKRASSTDRKTARKTLLNELAGCKTAATAIELIANHTRGERSGSKIEISAYNLALRLCARKRGGDLEGAEEVMSLMRRAHMTGDIVTYNTLLDVISKGAAQTQSFQQGLRVLNDMRGVGVNPDLNTYNSLLNIAAKGASIPDNSEWVTNGLTVLSMMRENEIEPDVISYNVLIDACARAGGVKGSRGRIEEGLKVLDQMKEAGVQPDTITYNTLINLCAKAARAIRILDMMGETQVAPDLQTYNSLLNTYAQAASAGHVYGYWEVIGILAMMRKEGLHPDLYSYNTIMNLCAKSAKIPPHVKGVTSWSLDEGMEVLKMMAEDNLLGDVVTYTALLETCMSSLRTRGISQVIEHGKMIFSMMKDANITPNTVSYTALINAAKAEGSPKAVLMAHELFLEMDPKERNERTYTAMIGAFARVGRFEDALKVFEESKKYLQPDRIMYSAIMSALSHEQSTVKRLHREMTEDGIVDDEVTAWQLKRAINGTERGRRERQPGAMQKLRDKKYMPVWMKAKRRSQ
ncbi:hypothetical protein GUITHDRAFT_135264 [Guillardia theta CCMP2712]|uniref:Pentacotripeptide-repeat region of PRORP domain-containing protein n=1 Tax=Guillardia theta (strain CCMP2712) TaxID=905079 RepID=L1JQA5_GUITC|nr:hypothetical protein GUITHDRAFT_135264 [Guillardia theta CCMP2712]EKX50647.1 hypothetical protein GUITHDRAFT_135264 [Guillardia theta CCMP2712]|eukprot:XP_005837627.1 hypothetical protein GUITHDRAFT_135264 [Guillardia theta CCMP2712]